MKIQVLFFALFSLTLFSSCDGCQKEIDTSSKTEVNTAFELAPPLSSDVSLQILDKPINNGNILVTARFDDSQVKGPFHAIMVNDEKLVLRDDGKFGDATANDGTFSIAVQDNVEELRKEFEEGRQQRLEFLNENRPLIEFASRVGTPVSDKFRDLDKIPFDLKKGVKFNPKDIFIRPFRRDLRFTSLMITDLGVVEDPTRTFNPCTPKVGTPGGAWTFGRLMTDMANSGVTGVSAEKFVQEWLDQWMNNQTINGDMIAARAAIFNNVIRPWVINSNPGITATVTTANWKTFLLDLKLAPFKLLAIVNRLDLRGNSGYSISNAGEGRFVFCAITPNCTPMPFTVIFEYGIPKKTCASLKAFANEWLNLSSLTPGTAAYNAALQAITDQFAAAGAGGSKKPNGSSINQVRTNERAIGSPWELREFTLNATTHLLTSSTVTQEPAKIYNRLAVPPATLANQQKLADYVNTTPIGNKVPLTFAGMDFLGGKSHTEVPGHFWDAAISGPASITNDDARFQFSLSTCSGCHGGEGRTAVGNLINNPLGVPHDPFLHITPQPFGIKTTLSAFLTGDPSDAMGLFRITDPAGRPSGSPTIRGFNDLDRRATDLATLATQSCKLRSIDIMRTLSFKPLRMPH